MKVLLTVLATAAWFAFSHYWYTCELVGACYGCAASLSQVTTLDGPTADQPVAEAAIRFEPGTATIIQSPLLTALRLQIQNATAGGANDDVLIATGYYDVDDPKPPGFANLGEARGAAAVEAMNLDLPETKYKLQSSLRTKAETALPGVEGATLRWTSAALASSAQTSEVAPVVKTSQDKATIRFPFDDADRALDPQLDVYLDELAARLRGTTDRVQLTGHTDDTGADDYNVALGDRRAAFIQERLVTQGIDASRIRRDSRGEKEPVSSNASEAGKSLNRRVDITIIPSKAQ